MSYAGGDQQTRAIDFWSGAGSLALAGGPILGGLLIGVADWRATILFNLPFGVAEFLMTWWGMPRGGAMSVG